MPEKEDSTNVANKRYIGINRSHAFSLTSKKCRLDVQIMDILKIFLSNGMGMGLIETGKFISVFPLDLGKILTPVCRLSTVCRDPFSSVHLLCDAWMVRGVPVIQVKHSPSSHRLPVCGDRKSSLSSRPNERACALNKDRQSAGLSIKNISLLIYVRRNHSSITLMHVAAHVDIKIQKNGDNRENSFS